MPEWLKSLVINLIKLVGLPLVKILSWLKWVPEEFWQALPGLLETMKVVQDKPRALKILAYEFKAIKRDCGGVACAEDVKQS